MISDLLLYPLVALIILLGGYSLVQKYKVNDLKEENQHQADAIVAYEQIIKVVPFESLNEERRTKANEEINTTLNSGDHIIDNTYKL